MALDVLGWNERWQKEFAALDAHSLVPGRVIGEHRSHYQVATDATEVSAGITGRLRNIANERSDLPGVGDFVALRLAAGDSPATIEVVLPRISALVRKAGGENCWRQTSMSSSSSQQARHRGLAMTRRYSKQARMLKCAPHARKGVGV